ncbi:MAG: hypothetical protein EZS28_048848, partial [Streblomastix strix]
GKISSSAATAAGIDWERRNRLTIFRAVYKENVSTQDLCSDEVNFGQRYSRRTENAVQS